MPPRGKDCKKAALTPTEAVDHAQTEHGHFCSTCGIEARFPTSMLLQEHYKSAEHVTESSKVAAGVPHTPKIILDPFATLHISPPSIHDQAAKAAKGLRNETHSDQMERHGGLTEEQKTFYDVKSAFVGSAVDFLSERDLRHIASVLRSQDRYIRGSKVTKRAF